MRLVVVGGGIAGLSAAWEARRLAAERGEDVQITVLEAEPRAGGKLWTEQADGISLEWGPDSFLASKPAARELAEELGLELVEPLPNARRAYLLSGGELRPFPPGLVMGIPRGPSGMAGAVRSGIVGPEAAARAAREPFVGGGVDAGTAAAELRRRLGPGWSTRLVEPLLEGVFGAPAEELGMREVLPAFAGERSLVLAARRMPAARGPAFLSIRGGMGALAGGLRDSLANEDLRLRTSAVAVVRRDDRFAVDVEDGSIEADAVVVAIPAPVAARVLRPAAPAAAETLEAIRFSSSAVILLRWANRAVGRVRTASGYLVPRGEGLAHAACTWVTSKWPHRATDLWLRAIVTSPEHLAAGDDALTGRVADEVGIVMRATAPPLETRLHRWEHALPVYAPGHFDRVARAEQDLPPGVVLAGASYRGLGVPDCVVSGRAAARAALKRRGQAPPRESV